MEFYTSNYRACQRRGFHFLLMCIMFHKIPRYCNVSYGMLFCFISLIISQGVTLLALGNGAPDIFSVLAALTSNNEDTAPLAFQELFGMMDFYLLHVLVLD